MIKENSLIFIGTCSGRTSLKRFHSSLLIRTNELNLLIDCGEGTSKALLTHNLSFDEIDAVLFTHLHPDHAAGFPSLIVQMKQQKRKKELKIFCHKKLYESLSQLLNLTYVFTDRASFELNYSLFEHDQRIKLSNEISIISKQNSHLDKYKKFLGENTAGFASSSYLIMLNDLKLCYTGDIASSEDLYLFEYFDPKIFIVEAAHVSFSDIAKLVEGRAIEKVYLTHYTDEYLTEISQALQLLQAELKNKVVIAFDGLEIEL